MGGVMSSPLVPAHRSLDAGTSFLPGPRTRAWPLAPAAGPCHSRRLARRTTRRPRGPAGSPTSRRGWRSSGGYSLAASYVPISHAMKTTTPMTIDRRKPTAPTTCSRMMGRSVKAYTLSKRYRSFRRSVHPLRPEWRGARSYWNERASIADPEQQSYETRVGLGKRDAPAGSPHACTRTRPRHRPARRGSRNAGRATSSSANPMSQAADRSDRSARRMRCRTPRTQAASKNDATTSTGSCRSAAITATKSPRPRPSGPDGRERPEVPRQADDLGVERPACQRCGAGHRVSHRGTHRSTNTASRGPCRLSASAVSRSTTSGRESRFR